MPRIVAGHIGSLVLVDGRFCVPAIAAADGATATGAAVAGVMVGTTATDDGLGETDGAGVKVEIAEGTGVGLADGATVNGGNVG